MTDPVRAFLNHGNVDQWTRGAGPITGIGTTMGHGSWPIYEAPAKPTSWRVFWRNPDTNGGDLWSQPGRFGTIRQWFPKQTGRWWVDMPANVAALRTPLLIPWDPAWKEVGGTQQQSPDNGVIVKVGAAFYEIQGMAALNWISAAHVNARTFMSGLPKVGDYRADGINYNDGTTVPQGSQGPWSKLDGLMRPSWLRGPWPGPVRLVGFNVQYGPDAVAVPGARVEHPLPGQPYPDGNLPAGNDPRMIPCGQVFKLRITDIGIEQWLDAEKIAENTALRVSKRWFARGLREHGMRLSETGTGFPILESTGGANPAEKAEWGKCGVKTEQDANKIGAGIFRFGELVAT